MFLLDEFVLRVDLGRRECIGGGGPGRMFASVHDGDLRRGMVQVGVRASRIQLQHLTSALVARWRVLVRQTRIDDSIVRLAFVC